MRRTVARVPRSPRGNVPARPTRRTARPQEQQCPTRPPLTRPTSAPTASATTSSRRPASCRRPSSGSSAPAGTYSLHQLIGRADLYVEEAADLLDEAGEGELAERVRREIVGRNVLPGRWTFQIVEEFDDGYWGPVRAVEREVRDALVDGRRHIFEAEMKERRRTGGQPGHESRPDEDVR
jgi:hypothetical protein